MNLKFLFLLSFLVCIPAVAQQTKTVTRTISDANQIPLPGAEVKVIGKEIFDVTNFDGEFTLNNVVVGDVFRVTFLGFIPQEFTISNENTYALNLQEDTGVLDEVVVIGYGTAQKRDLTGSIVTVSGDVVADKPSSNPVASLQGRVSGLSVVNSGRLGQEPDIRIRGTSSRYNTSPLYVVDGIFADDISFVNPNDIESIEVLKDASSLAIFGVRGANGVIIVTTKQAKRDVLTVNFNTSLGVKNIVGAPELADAALFRELYDERLSKEGLPPFSYYDSFTGDTDWVDVISNRDALIQTTNLSIQSSTEKNKISFGLGYRDEDGVIINEKLQRLTMNLNDELQLHENITLGLTVNGYRDRLPNEGSFGSALNAAPIASPVLQDSRPEYNGLYYQMPIAIGGAQVGNPLLVAEVTKNKRVAERYRFVGNMFAEIDFLTDFTFKASVY